MPYYRIVIWTTIRKSPFQGIRFIPNESITAVQGLMEKRAVEQYKSAFIDCEVQMLAKTCTAVRALVARMNKFTK